jgi:hypothetical protein
LTRARVIDSEILSDLSFSVPREGQGVPLDIRRTLASPTATTRLDVKFGQCAVQRVDFSSTHCQATLPYLSRILGKGRGGAMRRGTKVLIAFAILAAVALAAAPGASSQGGGASQLVVSGQLTPGVTTGTLGPFGIWVWCENENVSNPYAGECAGSMYFYDLGLTKFVEDVEGTLTLTSTSFAVRLASPDGSIDCWVSGTRVSAGPNNTITVSCSAPAGRSGTLSKVVINIT